MRVILQSTTDNVNDEDGLITNSNLWIIISIFSCLVVILICCVGLTLFVRKQRRIAKKIKDKLDQRDKINAMNAINPNQHHVAVPSHSHYQQAILNKQRSVSYHSVSTKIITTDDTMIAGVSSPNDLNQNSVSMNNNDEYHNISSRYLTSTLNDGILINTNDDKQSLEYIDDNIEIYMDENMDDNMGGLQSNKVDKELIIVRNNKVCPNKPLPKKIVPQQTDNV